jgi:uncharacterized protein YgiM (DUF1202 family)
LTGRFYFKPPEAGAVAAAPTADEEKLKTEKTYWDSVKDSGDAEDIQLYLNKYPDGYFVDLANAKLEELKGGAQVASAEPASEPRTSVQPPKQEEASAQTVNKPAAETSFIVQSQTVYAKSGGQVRADPNSKAAMVSKLPTNTEVTATGISTDGKWWRVQLADGQTGYMHNSVVSEQPIQTAAAAPAQPASPAQSQTASADALVPVSAPQAAPVESQGNAIASQLAQGLAQQLGLPVNIPQVANQQSGQQTAAGASFDPISKTVKIRPGATIFNDAGGQPMYQMPQGGPLLATGRSSDGRWYRVSLPTGVGEGYVPTQSVLK